MSPYLTETETVIKKILPYLRRRGYDDSELDFETANTSTDRYGRGYCDILVRSGSNDPSFLIEAKRAGKKLTNKDRQQALSYGKSKEVTVPFVVVTNGKEVRCFNTKTGEAIKWNGSLAEKIPSKDQLPQVLAALRANPRTNNIDLRLGGTIAGAEDESLPFRLRTH